MIELELLLLQQPTLIPIRKRRKNPHINSKIELNKGRRLTISHGSGGIVVNNREQ